MFLVSKIVSNVITLISVLYALKISSGIMRIKFVPSTAHMEHMTKVQSASHVLKNAQTASMSTYVSAAWMAFLCLLDLAGKIVLQELLPLKESALLVTQSVKSVRRNPRNA